MGGTHMPHTSAAARNSFPLNRTLLTRPYCPMSITMFRIGALAQKIFTACFVAAGGFLLEAHSPEGWKR